MRSLFAALLVLVGFVVLAQAQQDVGPVEPVYGVKCIPFNCKTNDDCSKMSDTKVCVSNPRTFDKGIYCCSSRP